MTPSVLKMSGRTTWPSSRRPGRPIRSRFYRAAIRGRMWHQLPRTLVILPVILLLLRIAVFTKQHAEYGHIDSYAIVEILLTGATILLLFWEPATLPVLRVVGRSALGWLLLYYIVGTISTLWSPMPLYTFFRGIQVLSQFLAVFVILALARSFAAMEFTFLAAGALAIVLELAGLLKLLGRISSLAAIHTCSYSNVGLILFTYCLAEYPGCGPARRGTLFWFGLTGLVTIVVGTSATTNVSAVFGVIVAVIVSGRRGSLQPAKLLSLCLLLLLGLLAWFAQDSVIAWLMPNKSAGEIQSFTGRRTMWEQLTGMFYQSPFLGHGFVASTRTGDAAVYNAHNVLLQALLDTGMVGTAILVLALAALGTSSLRALRHRAAGGAGFAAALAALLPVNITVPIWGVAWEKTVFAWACLAGFHTLSSRLCPPSAATSRPWGGRARGRPPFGRDAPARIERRP